jgi:predicted O-methyltransferase YrrM
MTSKNATQLLPRARDGAVPDPSWSDKLHVLAFGAISWPWLLKSLSGGRPEDKAALLARLGLPADALPNLGSWKADTALLAAIVDAIERLRPAMVVELGAGASTLVAAKALQLNGGGTLVSFDQHDDFVAATGHWLAEYGLGADMRAAALRPAPRDWPGVWYDTRRAPERIDLLIIDGPPWTIHPYVRGAAEELFDRIAVGGMVLLDDALRPGERLIARRWRKRWPGFQFRLDKSGTKGTLIGTRIR